MENGLRKTWWNPKGTLVLILALGLGLGLGFLMMGLPSCRKGEKTARSNGPVKTRVVKTKLGIDMVLIPSGRLVMGSRSGAPDETPVHEVWIEAFLMDKTEVTQDQYRLLGLSDPSRFQGASLPVERRTWLDAIRFCNVRSLQEGLEPCYNEETGECHFEADGYRLPTEAEWEYAARAGSGEKYSFGDDPRRLKDHAWYADNSGRRTHDVGTKKPNPWGLFDMYGNVAEWCHDYFDDHYYEKSPDKNPRGPNQGELRVIRGGSWDSPSDDCRSAYRAGNASVNDECQVSDAIGFRCVKNGPRSPDKSPYRSVGSVRHPGEVFDVIAAGGDHPVFGTPGKFDIARPG
jgi:formylglycine-generating enzyme required for sulfatase activity